MSIKLIAIDIDGTLLNSNHQVTDRVKQALKQAESNDVKIVLCTGRPITGVKPLLEELDLYKEQDYVITYNGSLVQQTATNQTISTFGLTHEDYLEIDLLARKLGVHLHTETEDTIYTSNRDISPYTIHEAYLVNMPLKYRTQEEMTTDLSIIKMMMIDEPAILDAIIPLIPQEFNEKYTVVKSAPFFLEILNKEVDKGAAVARLAAHLGIKKEEIMALGDNANDHTMIEYAGLGIAMDNAIDQLKEVADHLTASNDEDGVALAIERFVLNK